MEGNSGVVGIVVVAGGGWEAEGGGDGGDGGVDMKGVEGVERVGE